MLSPVVYIFLVLFYRQADGDLGIWGEEREKLCVMILYLGIRGLVGS